MNKIIIGMLLIIGLSGCSTMHQAGQEFVASHNLKSRVTTVCYDYWNKKDCPSGTLEADINVLSFIPGDSRFCFGLTYGDTPEGMTCAHVDVIR